LPAQDGTVIKIDKSFKIKAAASGGSIGWKAVDIEIIVCGSEVIGVDSASILYEFQVLSNSHANYPIASNFTTSDSDCPVVTYTLKHDNPADPATALAPTSLAQFNIINDNTVTEPTLWMNPDTLNVFTFYILGQSVTGAFVYKQVVMEVTEICIE